MDSKPLYEGYISRVSVFTHQYGSITLYGARIYCNLLIDGTFKECLKAVPCSSCGSMKVLRLRIEDMGFKISNNRKSLTKNLAGTPVLATLMAGDFLIDRIFIDKDKQQYNNTNDKYYKGHISEVIFVERLCRNRPASIGATLKCILNVNGSEKEFYKFLPHSYSFTQSQLREYLVLIGLPMRNKKKTIKENLEGLPIMATLDMFQQIEKIQVINGKRRKNNARN